MKRTISLFLVVLLCFGTLLSSAVPVALAQDEPDDSAKLSAELINYMESKPNDAWIVISFDIKVPSMDQIVADAGLVKPDDDASVEERSAYYETEWTKMLIAYANAKLAFYQEHLVQFKSQAMRSEYFNPTLWIQTQKSGIDAFVGLEEITTEIGLGLDWESPAYDEIFASEAPDSPLRRKLSAELYLYMQGKPDDILIPIHFHLRGLSKAEILTKAQLTDPEDGAPYAEVQAYTDALSSAWKAANAEISEKFVREHLDERANVVLPGLEMIVEVPKSQIAGLATLSEITSVIDLDLQRSPYAYAADLDDPEEPVNYDALNQAINEAEGIVAVGKYDYSPESLDALKSALDAAKAVLADENATQGAVDAAVSALKEAKAALAPIVHIPEPNTFTLDMAIAEAEAIDRSKYTDESLADLDQALNHAKWAKANYADYSQQKEVDAAAKNLEDAIAALAERPPEPFVFEDVQDAGKFCYGPVYWAFNHEPQITKGVDDTHFGPDQGCTRGQVVTFLWRAAGCPEPTKTENPFGDVKKSAFYYKAVLWAVENGVTKGTSETTFTPDATCTRGQIVTFLYRAKGAPEFKKGNNPFKDVASGQFYADAVAWAVENGVTRGKTADEFRPDATCTRGEVVTFLYRAMLLPEPVEPEPALTDINAMLLRGPSKGGNDTLPKQTVIISSTKELQDYLESIYEMEYFGGIAPDKYTDAYFVNNVLLLTPIRVCGSAPGFTITYVTENGKQILVELEKPGGPETPDMCAWVLLIEAAKSMPEREVVIDINQPLGPDCFYGFEAQSVDELIAWINGDVDEDSEAYWQREYFEDYMDAVEKKKRIPVVESAAQTYTRWSINVSSDTNILEYSFQNNDPEQGGLYIDFLMPDKPLEELIEEEGAFLREYFSDWELTESTVKVGGVDTQIFSWGGVENTIRESCKKVFEAPTAWFEYDGFVVHMYGDYRMSQTKWDDAWLEQFVFSTVELT